MGITELSYLIVGYKWAFFYLSPKALQRIQLNKTEIIKSQWQWQKILKFQYRSKIYNTELNLTEDCLLETILV